MAKAQNETIKCVTLESLNGNTAKGNYDVLGFGRAYSTFDIKNKTHVIKFDMTPQAVAQSFRYVENGICESMKDEIEKYLPKGRVKGDTFNFKIYVKLNPLSESSFTYLYGFVMEFKDSELKEKIDAPLSKLSTIIDDLTVKITKVFKNKNRRLEFKRVKSLIEKYRLSTLQKHAPVLTAIESKFSLSCVDIEKVKAQNLKKRSQNVDGTDNEFVHQLYCEGLSDNEIAALMDNFYILKKRVEELECAARDTLDGEINEQVLVICAQGGSEEDVMQVLGIDRAEFNTRFPDFSKSTYNGTSLKDVVQQFAGNAPSSYTPIVNNVTGAQSIAASIRDIINSEKKLSEGTFYSVIRIVGSAIGFIPDPTNLIVNTISCAASTAHDCYKKRELMESKGLSIPREIAKVSASDAKKSLANVPLLRLKKEASYVKSFSWGSTNDHRHRYNPYKDEQAKWTDSNNNKIEAETYWVTKTDGPTSSKK